MYAGCHAISAPRATRAARRSSSRPPLRMYHCRVVDDLERLVALLVELDRMGDRTRLALDDAGVAQGGHDPLARGERRGTDGRGVQVAPAVARDPPGGLRQDPAVPADDGAGRQRELAPPGHVRECPRTCRSSRSPTPCRVRQVVGDDRHLDVEDRGTHGRAEKWLVPLVVRVRNEGDARRQQLRARCLDVHRCRQERWNAMRW